MTETLCYESSILGKVSAFLALIDIHSGPGIQRRSAVYSSPNILRRDGQYLGAKALAVTESPSSLCTGPIYGIFSSFS